MKQVKGFTLIELMIVVVIVGVLAMIAYPSYQQYLRDTRRADGQREMLIVAAQLEKFFTQCSSYQRPPPAVAGTPPSIIDGRFNDCTGVGNLRLESLYTMQLTTTASTFLITAIPTGAQAPDDDCRRLTLRQNGERDQTGPNVRNRCWRR